MAKFLHISSVVLWTSAIIVSPFIILALQDQVEKKPVNDFPLVVWYRGVSAVGMIGTWVCGIALMTLGGWYSSSWLHAKIIFVMILSGSHGLVVRKLKQAQHIELVSNRSDAKTAFLASLVVILAVVFLVVVKPF